MSTDTVRTAIEDAIRNHSANSERTAQAAEGFIGASDVGFCRNRLAHMIRQSPRDEDRSLRWAAFVGTAVGDRLESAWAADDPEVVTQVEAVAELPSGVRIPCHADVVHPVQDYVVDFKSKDGLALYENGELDRSNIYQVVIYTVALRQAGVLTENSKAYLAYVDRSGRDETPVVREVVVDDEIITEIDEFIGDAIYAVMHDEEAARDRPYNMCEVVCPFFSRCRGADDYQAGGLIEDFVTLGAVNGYVKGLEMEKQGKRLKEDAKAALVGAAGSTGTHVVSWSKVGPTDIAAGTRRGYDRLSIRPIKKEG